jgi:predicted RNase H-like nuclease
MDGWMDGWMDGGREGGTDDGRTRTDGRREGGRDWCLRPTLAIFQLFRGIHKLISYRKHRLQQSQLKRDDHNTVAPNLKIIITVDHRDSYHQIDRKNCRLRF